VRAPDLERPRLFHFERGSPRAAWRLALEGGTLRSAHRSTRAEREPAEGPFCAASSLRAWWFANEARACDRGGAPPVERPGVHRRALARGGLLPRQSRFHRSTPIYLASRWPGARAVFLSTPAGRLAALWAPHNHQPAPGFFRSAQGLLLRNTPAGARPLLRGTLEFRASSTPPSGNRRGRTGKGVPDHPRRFRGRGPQTTRPTTLAGALRG